MGEIVLPRVTEILKSSGLIDTTWFTDEACLRGSYVHQACEFWDQGDLDESTVDPKIAPYLEAYKKWRRESARETAEWIEARKTDKLKLYTGMPDRILTVRPRQVVDLKTGGHLPWHCWQLASYVNTMDDPFSYERVGLYLSKDGTYSVRVFPKSEYLADLKVFQASLVIWYAKREHGIAA